MKTRTAMKLTDNERGMLRTIAQSPTPYRTSNKAASSLFRTCESLYRKGIVQKHESRRYGVSYSLWRPEADDALIVAYVSPAFGYYIDRLTLYHLALYAEGIARVEIRPLTERAIEAQRLTGASVLFFYRGRELYRTGDDVRIDAEDLVERFRLEINNLNTQE